MADIAKLLEGLLQNPETGKKIGELLGSDAGAPPLPGIPDGLDADMLMKITKAMSAMGNMKDDSETKLLCDLKPYISDARRKRVDEAVQILRMLRVINIISKEQII